MISVRFSDFIAHGESWFDSHRSCYRRHCLKSYLIYSFSFFLLNILYLMSACIKWKSFFFWDFTGSLFVIKEKYMINELFASQLPSIVSFKSTHNSVILELLSPPLVSVFIFLYLTNNSKFILCKFLVLVKLILCSISLLMLYKSIEVDKLMGINCILC